MQADINVTDLIWKAAHVHGFLFALFTQEQVNTANAKLLDLVARKEITPLVDRVFPLEQAGEAQRHLIEGGPSAVCSSACDRVPSTPLALRLSA
ncbi:zinc-binding dehydrogenase [Streptomyces sp. NPDC001312]|uniref:zinc-binding dehydrogenase n=1 Tax=Streptomyces sp. NPDC001312 TaxID=3364561 RepID=UPI00368DF458